MQGGLSDVETVSAGESAKTVTLFRQDGIGPLIQKLLRYIPARKDGCYVEKAIITINMLYAADLTLLNSLVDRYLLGETATENVP